MEGNNKEVRKIAQNAGSLLFVGCMFSVMAGGGYLEKMVIGMYAWMGLGFIMMAVAVYARREQAAGYQ